MTVYTHYSQDLNKLTANWFSENPSPPPIVEKFGKLNLPAVVDINSPVVPFDVILANGEVLASAEFTLASSTEAAAKTGQARTKWFGWNVKLPKREYLAAASGNTSAAERISELLKRNTSATRKKIDAWCTTGPTLASDRDYDPLWVAPLGVRDTTSETYSDPQDMNSTAGTVNDKSTTNFTGAGITANALQATVAADIGAFASKVDSYSDMQLLKGGGRDKFTMFVHPRFKWLMETNNVYDGSNYLPVTFAEQLRKMGVEMYPTHRVSYTGAVDATMTYILVPNIEENILFSWLPGAEYKVEPWDVGPLSATLMGWGVCACVAKPHTFDGGSTIEKAVRNTSVTPIGA